MIYKVLIPPHKASSRMFKMIAKRTVTKITELTVLAMLKTIRCITVPTPGSI